MKRRERTKTKDKPVREALSRKLRRLKLLVLDVDGVLTDGRIIYDDDGKETKFFHVRDGHGIKLLARAGLQVAIITSRRSRVVDFRAENLGIKLVYQGVLDKVQALNDIIGKTMTGPLEIGYMGDDVVDLPVIKRVGFSAAVPDAAEEVRSRVDYVTEKGAGRGAVREVCELILKAQGKWDDILGEYLR